jgi:hypothetical protein
MSLTGRMLALAGAFRPFLAFFAGADLAADFTLAAALWTVFAVVLGFGDFGSPVAGDWASRIRLIWEVTSSIEAIPSTVASARLSP